MKIPNTPSSAWVIPGLLRSQGIKGVRITYGQDEIIKAVCSYYGISKDVVLGKRSLVKQYWPVTLPNTFYTLTLK